MADKPRKFRPGNTPDSKSIFVRERYILNVANSRYEFELIAILTPLPPAGRVGLAVMPFSDSKRRAPSTAKKSGGVE
jgi:hypothetical protein